MDIIALEPTRLVQTMTTETKVPLNKLTFFARHSAKWGYTPLDKDYTYGGKSSMFGGIGTFKDDEESKSVHCHTCLGIPASGCDLEVIVGPWRNEDRWELPVSGAVDLFKVKFGKIKHGSPFSTRVRSLCFVLLIGACIRSSLQ